MAALCSFINPLTTMTTLPCGITWHGQIIRSSIPTCLRKKKKVKEDKNRYQINYGLDVFIG